MIFVFGGAYSGKAELVKNEYGIDKITPHDGDFNSAMAVRDIHLYIKKVMKNGENPYDAIDRIIEENPDIILISNEVGCGIVPMDKLEREWREVTGRIHCRLAERADKVIRVVCGIGVNVK